MSQVEGAKSALINMAIYYFQALVQSGIEVEEAKAKTADLLGEVYEEYGTKANIKFRSLKPKKDFVDLVNEVTSMAKKDINLKPVAMKLQELKTMLE